jgi:subtilisin family serine protease
VSSTSTAQSVTAAVGAAVAALALAAPLANAAPQRHSIAGRTMVATPFVSPPPKLPGRMVWFHWHPSARTLQGAAAGFGSTAVIGLESMQDLASLREQYGLDRVRAIPELHAVEVTVEPAHIRALLANAPIDSRIRYVAPTGPPRRLTSMPNDPLLQAINPAIGLPYEWQFGASHVDRALELSPGSRTIVVGTIDSGAADVPDLAGKIDSRWSISHDGRLALEPTAWGNDEQGHGTAVASLIAANVDDGFGMAGFGGGAHLIAVRNDLLTDTSIAISLTKLVSLGVRIVNMSVGGRLPSSPILLDAIHKAAADGVLLVAAAGNDAGLVAFPAANLQPPGGGRSFGLAVGATNFDGTLASFSNFGTRLSLAAPGTYFGLCSGVLVALAPVTEILDDVCHPTWLGDAGARYAYVPGTSFAAPEVAGVAALIWAVRPELTNYQVADIIKRTAQRNGATGWTPTLGCGVLDAGAALELATGYASDRAAGAHDGTACSAAGDAPPAWPAAVTFPNVHALPAVGSWGAIAGLRFRVSKKSGEFAATIVVDRDGYRVALLTRDLSRIAPGPAYSLPWQAPTVKTNAVYRFCVTLSDRAGYTSGASCGSIRLS